MSSRKPYAVVGQVERALLRMVHTEELHLSGKRGPPCLREDLPPTFVESAVAEEPYRAGPTGAQLVTRAVATLGSRQTAQHIGAVPRSISGERSGPNGSHSFRMGCPLDSRDRPVPRARRIPPRPERRTGRNGLDTVSRFHPQPHPPEPQPQPPPSEPCPSSDIGAPGATILKPEAFRSCT